jgi:phosphatidylglycerophosphatase A
MKTKGAPAVIPTGPKTLWAWTIATFFGSGLGKPGPGTWGSILAVLMWSAYGWLAHPSPTALLTATAIAAALATIFGVPAATIVERETGREDPGFVVIDEAAGQWLALLFAPFDWKHAVAALILFRLFDITKPYPIRKLERLPDGWGIIFDDLGAGLYALAGMGLLAALHWI